MKAPAKTSAALPLLHLERQADWANWLAAHHAASPGVWLQIAKKDGDKQSVSFAEAVETSLCFGWIDGQKQAHDTQFWLQKFTPRAAKSVWSKITGTRRWR